MRAFDGQHSDNVAIKRSREQKQMQLQQLKEQLANLKPHAAPSVREAMVKRISELDQELRQPPKSQRSGRDGGPRDGARSPRETSFRTSDSRSDNAAAHAAFGDGTAPRSPRGETRTVTFASPRRRG